MSQRKLRNEPARVMKDVEAGHSFLLTRRGQTMAQIVPLHEPHSTVPTVNLVASLTGMPHVDATALRADADAFFADGGDRVG